MIIGIEARARKHMGEEISPIMDFFLLRNPLQDNHVASLEKKFDREELLELEDHLKLLPSQEKRIGFVVYYYDGSLLICEQFYPFQYWPEANPQPFHRGLGIDVHHMIARYFVDAYSDCYVCYEEESPQNPSPSFRIHLETVGIQLDRNYTVQELLSTIEINKKRGL